MLVGIDRISPQRMVQIKREQPRKDGPITVFVYAHHADPELSAVLTRKQDDALMAQLGFSFYEAVIVRGKTGKPVLRLV